MRSEATGLAAEAALFHALSDPSRLLIVRHLSLGEHRVVDLTAHLGLAQSTVSKHLACLKDCGLVASRPEGRASVWSLTRREELLEVVATAANASGNWTATYSRGTPLPDGVYRFFATATVGGTESDSGPEFPVGGPIRIDTTPPSSVAVTGIIDDTGAPGDGKEPVGKE